VAKAWPVNRDHAVFFGGQINQPAGLEVLDHAAVAMQQDQRRSCAAVDVMESSSVHRYEPPEGRVTTASHRFNSAGATAATTIPAANGTALEEVRA
jgi:hypothetical protein